MLDQVRASTSRVAGRLALSPSVYVLLLELLAALLVVRRGLASLATPLEWLQPPSLYQKDFLAAWLLARAVASRMDPYVPLNDLARLFPSAPVGAVVTYVSPHPPTLGLLLWPFTTLDYDIAAKAWLAFEVACLAAAVWLLLGLVRKRPSMLVAVVITAALLPWYPVNDDLSRGQLGTVLLLLLTGMVLARRSGRPVTAGILLGLSILVKQIAWPLFLVLLLHRQWKMVLAGAITTLVGYLIVAAMLGPGTLVVYLTRALPEVSREFHTYPWNLSIWTLGERLFGGMAGGPPLLPIGLASAAPFVSLLAALGALVAVLWAVRPPMRLEWALGAGLLLSLVVSPIAWEHYLVIAILPATLVVDWLIRHGLPRPETQWVGLCFLSMAGYPAVGGLFIGLRNLLRILSDGGIAIHPSPVTVLLIPLTGVLALTWLMASIARRDQAMAMAADEEKVRIGEPGRSPYAPAVLPTADAAQGTDVAA